MICKVIVCQVARPCFQVGMQKVKIECKIKRQSTVDLLVISNNMTV